MRTASLFLLVLVVLLYPALAESQPAGATPAAQDFKVDLSQLNLRPGVPLSLQKDGSLLVINRVPDWSGSGEPTCYSIRRYLMKRDSPRSDVTFMAGYSTCISSRHVELAPAVAAPAKASH